MSLTTKEVTRIACVTGGIMAVFIITSLGINGAPKFLSIWGKGIFSALWFWGLIVLLAVGLTVRENPDQVGG